MFTATQTQAVVAQDPKFYTVEDLRNILAEACDAARKAADTFFHDVMNGQDSGACGFAWVNIYLDDGKYGTKIKASTKLGKNMKAAGIRTDWQRVFQVWNPSGYPVQNIDTLEAGAQAAAEVFKRYGFAAYAGSRLD